MAFRKSVKASSPPADAPSPTTRKGCRSACSGDSAPDFSDFLGVFFLTMGVFVFLQTLLSKRTDKKKQETQATRSSWPIDRQTAIHRD
jgi:hypothetical protein